MLCGFAARRGRAGRRHSGGAYCSNAAKACAALWPTPGSTALSCRRGRSGPAFASLFSDGIFAIGNQRRRSASDHCRRDQHGHAIGLASLPAIDCGARICLTTPQRATELALPIVPNGAGNLRLRIHAAALFANLAMRPATHVVLRPVLKRLPRLLTVAASISGKVNRLPTAP